MSVEMDARCTEFVRENKTYLDQYMKDCLLKEVEGVPFEENAAEQKICIRSVNGMIEGGRNLTLTAEFAIVIWRKPELFIVKTSGSVGSSNNQIGLKDFETAIEKNMKAIRFALGRKLCAAIHKRNLGFTIDYSKELGSIKSIYFVIRYASEILKSPFMMNVRNELTAALRNNCPDAAHKILPRISVTGSTFQIVLKINADYPCACKTIRYSTFVNSSLLLSENHITQNSLDEIVEYFSEKLNKEDIGMRISKLPVKIELVGRKHPLYKQVQEKIACATVMNQYIRFTCPGMQKEVLLEEYADHIVLRNDDVFYDSSETEYNIPNSVYAAAEFALQLRDSYEKRISESDSMKYPEISIKTGKIRELGLLINGENHKFQNPFSWTRAFSEVVSKCIHIVEKDRWLKGLSFTNAEYRILEFISENPERSISYILREISVPEVSACGLRQSFCNVEKFLDHKVKKSEYTHYQAYFIAPKYQNIDFSKHIRPYGLQDKDVLTVKAYQEIVSQEIRQCNTDDKRQKILPVIQKMPKKYVLNSLKTDAGQTFFHEFRQEYFSIVCAFLENVGAPKAFTKNMAQKIFLTDILKMMSEAQSEDDQLAIIDTLSLATPQQLRAVAALPEACAFFSTLTENALEEARGSLKGPFMRKVLTAVA